MSKKSKHRDRTRRRRIEWYTKKLLDGKTEPAFISYSMEELNYLFNSPKIIYSGMLKSWISAPEVQRYIVKLFIKLGIAKPSIVSDFHITVTLPYQNTTKDVATTLPNFIDSLLIDKDKIPQVYRKQVFLVVNGQGSTSHPILLPINPWFNVKRDMSWLVPIMMLLGILQRRTFVRFCRWFANDELVIRYKASLQAKKDEEKRIQLMILAEQKQRKEVQKQTLKTFGFGLY